MSELTIIGIIITFHYDYKHNSKMNQAFVAAYNAEFKRNPDFFSVGGYDGVHLIYEVLRKTGGKTDAESLIAAAKGTKWESPRGPVSIDPETRDVRPILRTGLPRRLFLGRGAPLHVEQNEIGGLPAVRSSRRSDRWVKPRSCSAPIHPLQRSEASRSGSSSSSQGCRASSPSPCRNLP
jgi:hypothetical protein